MPLVIGAVNWSSIRLGRPQIAVAASAIAVSPESFIKLPVHQSRAPRDIARNLRRMKLQLQTAIKIDSQCGPFRFTHCMPRCFGVRLQDRPLFKRINEDPPPNVDVSIWEIRA